MTRSEHKSYVIATWVSTAIAVILMVALVLAILKIRKLQAPSFNKVEQKTVTEVDQEVKDYE